MKNNVFIVFAIIAYNQIPIKSSSGWKNPHQQKKKKKHLQESDKRITVNTQYMS